MDNIHQLEELKEMFDTHDVSDTKHFSEFNKHLVDISEQNKKQIEQNVEILKKLGQSDTMWSAYLKGGTIIDASKMGFAIAMAIGGAWLLLKNILK